MLLSEVIVTKRAPSTVLQIWQNSISKDGLFKLQKQNLRELIIRQPKNIQLTILDRGILYRVFRSFFEGLKAIDPMGVLYFGFINLHCTSASILKGVQAKLHVTVVDLTNASSSTNLLRTYRILKEKNITM